MLSSSGRQDPVTANATPVTDPFSTPTHTYAYIMQKVHYLASVGCMLAHAPNEGGQECSYKSKRVQTVLSYEDPKLNAFVFGQLGHPFMEGWLPWFIPLRRALIAWGERGDGRTEGFRVAAYILRGRDRFGARSLTGRSKRHPTHREIYPLHANLNCVASCTLSL